MLQSLRQSNVRRMACTALLVPLLFYSFFAVGTMPALSSQGFEIVICSGDVVKTITVDENGKPIEEQVTKACDWSLLVHDGSLAIFGGVFSYPVLIKKQISLFEKSVYFARRIASHVQARGPPTIL